MGSRVRILHPTRPTDDLTDYCLIRYNNRVRAFRITDEIKFLSILCSFTQGVMQQHSSAQQAYHKLKLTSSIIFDLILENFEWVYYPQSFL